VGVGVGVGVGRGTRDAGTRDAGRGDAGTRGRGDAGAKATPFLVLSEAKDLLARSRNRPVDPWVAARRQDEENLIFTSVDRLSQCRRSTTHSSWLTAVGYHSLHVFPPPPRDVVVIVGSLRKSSCT
jgi:hypothetical protein